MRKRRIVFGVSISLKKVISQLQDRKHSFEKDGEYTDRQFESTNDGRDPAEGICRIAAWNVAAAVV